MNEEKLTDTEIALLKLTQHNFAELQKTVESILNDHAIKIFTKMTKERIRSSMTPEQLEELDNLN